MSATEAHGPETTAPPGELRAAPSAAHGAAETVIEVEDLSVVLGSHLILSAVDLRVTAGESMALLGANGSGKSTLVKTILGLNPIAQGKITVFGHDISRRRSVRWRRIGYVPQRVGSTSGVPATALEVVRSGMLSPSRPFADRGRAAQKTALEALDAVGMASRAHDHVQILSGGQAQRVLIARALVRHPDLLLLDEPLSGIDRESRQALATILQDLRSHGITLVTVLHEMGELAEVVERVVVLDEGRVVLDSPAQALHATATDHPYRVPDLYLPDSVSEHPHGVTLPAQHHAPRLSTDTSTGTSTGLGGL